jgi:hypothetical protein
MQMKERKMILSFRGKWLISLLMLLLMSVGVHAQYDISVAGTTVTSANASNVLGDGKVSFEPTTNTLTLNGAVITLSESTPYAVSSGIKDLKIKLIGENVINASTSPVFDCEPDAEEGDITFVTETGAGGAVYGSLQINGIYQYDNLTERYHIKNTWLESDEDGWHKKEMGNEASDERYVKLFYAKYYDLWIKGERISLENVNSIGEGISFDEEANTLTLDNATLEDNILTYGTNLIISLVGESTINGCLNGYKCNGKNAEFCDQYVHKGDMMYVEGRIHYDSFINKDGIEVRTTEIRASIVKKLYSANDDKTEDRQRPRASQAIRVGGGKQTQDDLPY